MAVYGIDLGTTYSCLAKFEGGTIKVIENEGEGKTSLASAVYFGPNGDVLVGDEAKAYFQTESHRVIQFVKREIGKDYAPHEIDGKSYNAIEISALILKKIVKYAAEQGETVKDVVITCPAYFGNEERDATRKAGILAGLNVLELVNEPTAAAISYAYTNSGIKDETVLVYDLGGGTFDVTVLQIKTTPGGVPSCTVLASDGDDTLGGKDWDEVLKDIIRQNLINENSIMDELTNEDLNNIGAIVEETKKSLSNRETVTVRCVIGGETMTADVTRDEFEAATKTLLKKTTDCLERVIQSTSSHPIDKILLVGGSSNMPMVAKTLTARYGEGSSMASLIDLDAAPRARIPVVKSDPETAVCKGAAVFADLLSAAKKKRTGGFATFEDQTQGENIIIHDIASRSFGVAIYFDDELCLDTFVYKGDQMPAEHMEQYSPRHDNQSSVALHVYESIAARGDRIPMEIGDDGEIINVDARYQVKHLGKLVLRLPPNTPKSTPLYTTMACSGSGIHIRCENGNTGDIEECDIQFKNSDVNMDNNHINALSIE